MEPRCLHFLPYLSLLFFSTSLLAQMEGEIRLTGLNSTHKGRVEVFLDGQWGTVCDNDYGRASSVICYQLNFTSPPSTHTGCSIRNLDDSTEKKSLSSYPDDVPIHSRDIDCGPIHSNPPSVIHFLRCEAEELDEDINCTHTNDLVVFCNANTSDLITPYLTQVRLVKDAESGDGSNGTSAGGIQSSGTLEIFLNYTWGNLCLHNFTKQDGDSACRQMGYTGSSSIFRETATTAVTVWVIDHCISYSNYCMNACFEPSQAVAKQSCEDGSYVGLECEFDRSHSSALTSGNPIKCNYTKRYSKVPTYFIGIMGGAFLEWVVSVTIIVAAAVCFTHKSCPGFKYQNRASSYLLEEQ